MKVVYSKAQLTIILLEICLYSKEDLLSGMVRDELHMLVHHVGNFFSTGVYIVLQTEPGHDLIAPVVLLVPYQFVVLELVKSLPKYAYAVFYNHLSIKWKLNFNIILL